MKNNLGMHYRKRDNTIEVTTPKKKEKLYFDGISATHTSYGIRIKPSEYATISNNEQIWQPQAFWAF